MTSDSSRCIGETEAETMLAVCGNVESRRNAPHPTRCRASRRHESQSSGLSEDEQNHMPALPAQGAQDADLAGALEDRHGHGVGDAQNADQ
jgi:hypothetical protein